MYNNHILSTIQNLEIVTTDLHNVVMYNGAAYRISKALATILQSIQREILQRKSIDLEKALSILKRGNPDYEMIDVNLLEEQLIAFVNQINSSTRARSSYISLKITIIPENIVNTLSSFLGILFKYRLVFFSLFLVCFFINSYAFITFSEEIDSITDFTPLNLVIFYILFFVILILHEFGHAAALCQFGRKPKSIGFGFYLFFPVLYADVTEAWLLPKWKRIFVNLGGIYFQLMCGSLIALLTLFFQEGEMFFLILQKLFWLNFFVALYSLIPFFRNDGYWVYSDLFDLPNLLSSSQRILIRLQNEISNWKLFYKTIKDNLALFSYAVADFLFWHYVAYTWFFFMLTYLQKVEIDGGVGYVLQKPFSFFAAFFMILVSGYFIGRGIIKKWQLVFNK